MKILNILLFTAGLSTLSLASSCQNNSTSPTTVTESTVTAVKQEQKTPPEATNGIQVGDTAPDFLLKNVDGKTYGFDNIVDSKGNTPKGYIVTFTCNTCPYAVLYEDRLIALHNKTAPLGYPLVAIQANDPDVKPGDSFENMQQRAIDKDFPFLYLLDEGQKVYPQYGATRTPEIYLVDSDKIVRYHGAIDDNAQEPKFVSINYVENAIHAIDNGNKPDPSDVKAIGCTIKTKRI